jgi:hypothetical protein
MSVPQAIMNSSFLIFLVTSLIVTNKDYKQQSFSGFEQYITQFFVKVLIALFSMQ